MTEEQAKISKVGIFSPTIKQYSIEQYKITAFKTGFSTKGDLKQIASIRDGCRAFL